MPKKKVTIEGNNQTIYINSVGQSTTEETVLLKGKAQNIVWITMSLPPETDRTIFDQILSTFKFLGSEEPSGAGCQYNGKTYKDGEAVPSIDKCNSCSCSNGQIACTAMACE